MDRVQNTKDNASAVQYLTEATACRQINTRSYSKPHTVEKVSPTAKGPNK